MGDFSWATIVVAAIASIGGISGLVSLVSFVAARLDNRRKRIDAQHDKRLHDSVEFKKLQGASDNTLIENLWKIIADKDRENDELKAELDECNKKYSFSRPITTTVYQNARGIIAEIEAMNIMILDEEQTQVFMRRFAKMRELALEIQKVLP